MFIQAVESAFRTTTGVGHVIMARSSFASHRSLRRSKQVFVRGHEEPEPSTISSGGASR